MNSNRLCSDIKGFLKDKVNILILLILISNLFFASGIFFINGKIESIHSNTLKCEQAITKCEKKVDFRKTDIDTKDGRIRITPQTIANR